MNFPDFVMNWIIFRPHSKKKWIFKMHRPGLLETCIDVLAFCVKLRLFWCEISELSVSLKLSLKARNGGTLKLQCPQSAGLVESKKGIDLLQQHLPRDNEVVRWSSFLHNRKRELFRYEVNNVKSTCCSICVWRSGPRKREILIDPMKDYIYVIVYVSSFAAFL